MRVNVFDAASGEVLHRPPPADQLQGRLAKLCEFANRDHSGVNFIHPIIKAIILHFWLGFDHPFEDGNGRLAHLLFYWSMLTQDYWLFEYISISKAIAKAPSKYSYAYLYSETDQNDITYFIVNQLEVILSSIADLGVYVKEKQNPIASLEAKLRWFGKFNYRQMALLSHAIRGSGDGYTIESHRRSHAVAYATARADLLGLVDFGFLYQGAAKAKAMWFYPVEELQEKINNFSPSSTR